MQVDRAGRPSGVATEANTLVAGLGVLMIQIAPLALPGLLLFFIAPLVLVVIAGVLLAAPLILPVWLTRTVLRRRSRRPDPAVPGRDAMVPA